MDRYITVETTKTLQVPTQSFSMTQWKSDFLADLKTMYFINDDIDSQFSPESELVLMGKQLTTSTVATLISLLSDLVVTKAKLGNLGEIAGVGFIRLTLNKSKNLLNAEVKAFAAAQDCDFALITSLPDFSQPGLVLMDMDSTTIQIECIDEIARLYGVGDEVSAVTAAAMRGELDFNGSLRTRVSKLSGAPETVLKEVADSMPLMPGLIELIAGLKAVNWKVAIASGGFTYFANRLKGDHGFDAAYANTLEIVDGTLTGEVVGEIVNADVKASKLKALAEQFDIPQPQTVAIGDGANDLVMMAASALGIAIHAKPIVQEKASVALNQLDLEGALCLLSSSLPFTAKG